MSGGEHPHPCSASPDYVSSKPGFWEFNKKRVTGRLCAPCRNLGGTEPGEGRQRVKDQKGGGRIQRSHQLACDAKATSLDTQLRHE